MSESGNSANSNPAAPLPALGLDSLDAFDTTAGGEDGAVMEVLSPRGDVLRWPDGRPWTITYYGADSERMDKLAIKQQNRQSAVVFRTRQPLPAEAARRDNLDTLVDATKTWDIPLANGQPAAADPKEYRAAYVKYKWLFDQGWTFHGTRANFLKAGSTP